MSNMELSPVRQNFSQLIKSSRKEIGFTVVTPCKRVMAFDGPVHFLSNMGEEFNTVALFQASENGPDLFW